MGCPSGLDTSSLRRIAFSLISLMKAYMIESKKIGTSGLRRKKWKGNVKK